MGWSGNTRASATVTLLGAALALLPAGSASADVTCNHDDAADVLEVFLSDTGPGTQTSADMQRAPNGDINVVNNGTIACSGPQATVNNVDNINAFDVTAGGGGNVSFSILRPEEFAPGATIENGSALFSEIEFNVALDDGFDGFSVFGDDGSDQWRFDSNDINFGGGNGDPVADSELAIFTGVDGWRLDGYQGSDLISGQGQPGGPADFNGTFGGDTQLLLIGGDGGDALEGGDGPGGDVLDGQDGSDAIRGFGGHDRLEGREDDDTLAGGAGFDSVDYSGTVPVTVDLAQTGPQNTGHGIDTLTEIEEVRGGDGADTLLGDAGANFLRGMRGNDTISGRAGSDRLFGGDFGVPLTGGDGDDMLAGGAGDDEMNGATGTDTVTFATAAAGISANLAAGTATGDGSDTVTTTENLIGSPFADTLTGSDLANSITGLGGGDTISALAGADSLNVRDGGPDTASCGTEIDSATADQASVDNVNADCETVSFLAEPDPGGGGEGGGDAGGGDTEIGFDLVARAKQRVLKQRGVVVRATCPLEDCTATAAGRARVPKPRRSARAKLNLKPVTEPVAAGSTEKIKLRLRKRQLRMVAAALRAGKRPKVRISASATDAAGNAATDSAVVRAKP